MSTENNTSSNTGDQFPPAVVQSANDILEKLKDTFHSLGFILPKDERNVISGAIHVAYQMKSVIPQRNPNPNETAIMEMWDAISHIPDSDPDKHIAFDQASQIEQRMRTNPAYTHICQVIQYLKHLRDKK